MKIKMKTIFFSLFLLIVLATGVNAQGTYGNETYGNFSYGVASSAESVSTETVNFEANITTIVNTSGITNATLEITTNSNVSGFVNIVQFSSLPSTVGSAPATSLNKIIDIVVGAPIRNSLNYSIIKLKYSDAEVIVANLQESTMRLYRWNGTNWILFDGNGIGGINTTANFVFANTSTFSTWGIFGTAVASSGSGSGSGGGGGGGGGGSGGGGGGSAISFTCNQNWVCDEWSNCVNKVQNRECNFIEVTQYTQIIQCPEEENIPETSRACITLELEIGTSEEEKNETEITIPKTTEEPKGALNAITAAVTRVLSNPDAVEELQVTVLIIVLVFGFLVYKKRWFRKKKQND